MSTAHPTPTAEQHTAASGAICPTCRLSAALDITHLCIGVDSTHRSLERLLTAATTDQAQQLLTELAKHPAQPVTGNGDTVRAVHRSWCFCQCSREPAVPGEDGARS